MVEYRATQQSTEEIAPSRLAASLDMSFATLSAIKTISPKELKI